MGEFLLGTPTAFAKFARVVADQPGLFLFDKPFKVGKKNPDFYKGKIIILVNEVTQSMQSLRLWRLKKLSMRLLSGVKLPGPMAI
jgi:hypothetical protein